MCVWIADGFTHELDGDYPMFNIALRLRRLSLYYIVNLIVPCCLLSVIALSTFLLPPSSDDRLGIGRLTYVLCVITGSIARSANLPVFNLLRGRFWGFSPRRGDTLHRWGWNLAWRTVLSSMPNFTPIGATTRVQDPKIEIFTQIWPKCGIWTHRRGVPLVGFSQNLQSLYDVSGSVRC